MSKEERFETQFDGNKWLVADKENDTLLGGFGSAKMLNEFVDKIADLEAKLSLTEKALELTCEECLSFPCSDYCSSNDDCEDCYYKREFTPEKFKTKAKEMMKSE